MIGLQCRTLAKNELEKLGMYCIAVETGQVEVLGNLSDNQLRHFKAALLNAGLELIEDRKKILIERIKSIVLDMIDNSDYPLKNNFSFHLSQKLNLDYTYLANVFSAMQGITIEHFIIANKIRRVKELICVKDLNLTEISRKLNYSSVAHLSSQFKKVTGVTPSHFKYIKLAGTFLPAMCEL